jgi:hypothetical protein
VNSELKNFVRQIINIDATPPGTNASYGGFIGASNPRQQAVEDLKRKTLEFAKERSKQKPDASLVNNLAASVEGHLHITESLAVIDSFMLDKLIDELSLLKI